MQVNNTIYETYGSSWWDDDAPFDFTSLRYAVNPARYGYFTKVLAGIAPAGRRVLDIGCGGGYLAERFAEDGYDVSAVDPAIASIDAARRHAGTSGLSIDYRVGRGESLPFPDGSFDIVSCCDVLEHVDDVGRVIAEASRTLKDRGVFLYDTVNRTTKSWFALIKMWQDWGVVGLREPNAHVWKRFIAPHELSAVLRANRLRPGEMKGMSPRANPLALLWTFLQIRRGRIRNEAVGRALQFDVSDDLAVSYLGYAVKTTA